LKKALVVDWLDRYGGAERVIASLENVFSFEKTYTLINVMTENDLIKIYKKKKREIIETPIRFLKNNFRFFFFLFHYSINKIVVDKDISIIISSSHAVAKGIQKSSKEQLHISYFQARNFNYIWDDNKLFFGNFSYLLEPIFSILRRMDIKQAQNPDYIVANSNFVKQWIKEKYNREATIIYPPVDLSNFFLVEKKKNYYVSVGRIVSVKRFDILIETFKDLDFNLIIIGNGDNYEALKKKASNNVLFTGFLESNNVNEYISNAKGFIQVGVEGFGIASLEAQACGTPVIAFGKGGVLETVIEGKTGVFFKEQTAQSLKDAILYFETLKFNPKEIREHALQFSKERFESEIKAFVEEKYLEHQNLSTDSLLQKVSK
jgi:glycosyltransferase involved in cell wall biosynthesis